MNTKLTGTIILLLSLVQGSILSAQTVDLELALEQEQSNPDQFSLYSITAQLTNEGSNTATGVSVSFPIPDGVVYEGGNEFELTQGTFDPNGEQIWMLGSLASGQTATLTVSYFLLESEAPTAYAQVQSVNEADIDSSPNNGTPPQVNEDDEASTGGGQKVCEIDANLIAINCDDNNTPNDDLDDSFTLDLTAEIIEGLACSPNFTIDGQSAPYGSIIELGPFSTNTNLSFFYHLRF